MKSSILAVLLLCCIAQADDRADQFFRALERGIEVVTVCDTVVVTCDTIYRSQLSWGNYFLIGNPLDDGRIPVKYIDSCGCRQVLQWEYAPPIIYSVDWYTSKDYDETYTINFYSWPADWLDHWIYLIGYLFCGWVPR